MSDNGNAVHALSSAERRALGRHLRAHRRQIVEAWTVTQFDADRLKRWQVAGVEHQDRASFQRGFLGPLVDLLAGWLATGEPGWRALYRDERLRYAPHQASPADRARFFTEILADDEGSVLTGAPAALRTTLAGELRDVHMPLRHPRPAAVRVLALGDCLMNEIRTFLPDACRDRGFEVDVRGLYFSAVVTRDISTTQVREFLARQPMDVLAFSFLSYEALPLYAALLRDADGLGRSELAARVTAIVGLMRRFLGELRELTDAPFLVHNASGLPLTRLRRRLPLLAPFSSGRRRALDAINDAIAELVAHTTNAILIDEATVAATRGYRGATAPVVRPPREAAFHARRLGEYLAAEYADVLASFERLRKAKVLAVDFDNTLWDGVMADGPVGQRHDRQALLKAAKNGGMLLVAVSKNDPANVRWGEMTLTPDDFVLHKIGWDLKVESITAAAKQLDLGLDSFVLLDDSHTERELVRSQLPTVRILDSTDAFAWRSIDRLLRFPNTKDTAEARSRTELYRQQAQRQEALSGGFDYPAMMASLGLVLDFRRATAGDLDRLTELVQRTNQFNTTTKRYTRQHLQDMMTSERHRVWVTTLADKFGSLGLVLVVIVERRGEEAVIDSVVMSCRAMGFQLEHAVLRLVLDAEPDVGRWVGLFVPSDRNTPAAGLFGECGFVSQGDHRWLRDSDASEPVVPAWFTVTRGEP
jgi:FkbH-like protein